MSIDWGGSDQRLIQALDPYYRAVIDAVERVAKYFEPVLGDYAQTNARWKDHSSNARQSLHAFSESLANDVVELYLSHGMEYGIYLEVRWAGKYAIIWPTIAAHLQPIAEMLQGIFS